MIGFHEARHLMDNFSHRKNMMSGDVSPLQFANLDATLYGADLRFSYNLNSNLYLSGLASCVRAIRDDNDDNLYRISPANAALSLNYLANDWDAVITFKAVAAQNKVSLINQEQATSGYGLISQAVNYDFNNQLSFRLAVDNITNKEYQNHLGGYNRVKMSEIPTMDRLPSQERTGWAEMTYSF